MKKKKWILRTAFFVLVVVTAVVINNIFELKSPHGINQTRAFYEQPRNTIDVLAIGSSHVHCGINTATLWDEYGIAAYDFSAAEQPLWTTYYYLKESYKYQSPGVVVLDVFSAARYKDDYHYKWLHESTYGMRFSMNKMDMLKASSEPEFYKDYFPSFLSYHNRYNSLGVEDFRNIFGKHSDKLCSKGFTPGYIISDQTQPFEGWESIETNKLTDKSEKYLNMIIDLAEEKGSRLYIIVVPYNMDEDDKVTYEQIKEIAESRGVTFIDFNEHKESIGLDMARDMNDPSHLNYWGSVKFSEYLGDILKDEVPTHIGEKKYASWDKHNESIKAEAAIKESLLGDN